MDPFVEQLKSLCKAHPTRAKWVFVPTHSIGRTLGERIAREGTDWLNLRFVTPLDVALRMGAPFLVERGIDPSEEGLGPALMMRLLLERPEEGGYFRPLASHPTLAQALWTTVRELRMAGLAAVDLTPRAFSSSSKHGELSALFLAYESFLERNHLADLATVYHEAVKHLDWCPIQPEDCWAELPDAGWNPLQRRLLAIVPGERIVPSAFRLKAVNVPRRLASSSVVPIVAAVAVNPIAFLMEPAGSGKQTDRIALFHAGGREAEIEEVFRRILAAGAPLDQVEIACASDAHVALVWEKAQRHDWPVTLGSGIPATFTRPARALLGFCDWIETDFAAGHFRRLLQSGDVRVDEAQGFKASEAGRVLVRAQAGWGRNTYRLALTRLLKHYEAEAADADASDADRTYANERAEQVGKVRSWLTSLVESVPEPAGDGKVPLQAVVESALAFLDSCTARSNALDNRAAAALADHIADLRALGSFSCALPDALHFVRERVESLTVAPERPRPGHLYAGPLYQSGYSGRPHLFVVGLEEGRVFAGATEDAVLLDAERTVISPDLRLSTDRIDEAVYGVLSRLAVCGGHVTFSYSSRDTREFRETFASWLMLQAHRLQQGNPSASYPDMKRALGEPKSAVPLNRREAISESAWWLRSVRSTNGDGVAAVESRYPTLSLGRVADGHRSGNAFTQFDGWVPEAGAVLDPSLPSNAYSVTELEKAAECPFRFFLKRGLGIRPVDDRERDRDVWLDPLTRGSELHDIYAAMLRRTRDANRRPAEADREWLLNYTGERLRALNDEMPAPTKEVLDRETRDFIDDVHLFLEAEIADTQRTAVGLEVSFGRPLDDGDTEPLAREEPVTISLGQGLTFKIAGRMDRIDQVGTGTFEVLDYKTGGYWRDDFKGVFNGGKRLQHALYGLAAVELLKAKHQMPQVTGGVYYFSSHKGRGERVRIGMPALAAVAKVLGDLREVIASGHFTRAADEKACRFCDFVSVCGSDTNVEAKAKLGDARAAAFGRLAKHV